MQMHLASVFLLFVGLTATTTQVNAQETRELDSHQHGHVKLEIAIEKSQLNIALEAPGESIIGFEHVAKTEKQKTAVKAALEQLSDPVSIFVMPSKAGCRVSSSNAELHQHGGHNEFEASYAFTCTNIAEFQFLETKLFSLYPAIDEIDAVYVAHAGQGNVELKSGSPMVVFAPAN